ncbi:MAG: CPBP family intramembrane metalloprotease [Ruminococcus sp.]|nr:CPBP family intramembrane metalloprotease [Ruminococcus sp.]
MSNEKRLTIKRLAIFLVISFLPFVILIPVLWNVYGEPLYAGENEQLAAIAYVVGVFGMMIPSAAVLITRLATKEGFEKSYLGAYFKGKSGYWAASVIVPVLESITGLLMIWAFFISGTSLHDSYPNINSQTIGEFILQLSSSVIIFFPAFGEEWGWRGYMMPKLLKLMPKPAAIVVGGIIWGLWHAPLTVAGHNFGTDYPGYPFTGIGIMCLECVLMNCFLTLVTEKTRSIYPAAFFHMIHNNLNPTILILVFASADTIQRINEMSLPEKLLTTSGGTIVTAVISFILFLRMDKPQKSA